MPTCSDCKYIGVRHFACEPTKEHECNAPVPAWLECEERYRPSIVRPAMDADCDAFVQRPTFEVGAFDRHIKLEFPEDGSGGGLVTRADGLVERVLPRKP